MKQIYLLLAFIGFFITNSLQAQIHNNFEIPTSINEDGALPHPSAILDLQALKKGLLIPRMKMSARNSIFNATTGLLIYQTDNTPGFYYYDGTTWVPLSESSLDNDPVNELQTLTLINDYLALSSAGGVLDLSAYNNAQAAQDAQDTADQNATDIANNTTAINNHIANDGDMDDTNEIELPTGGTNGQILETDGTNVSWVDKPQGFSGDYNDLTNTPTIPTVPTNVSAFTNDAGYITSPNDADANATNELISNATLSGTDLEITDAGGTTTVDLSSLQDGVDDADNDPSNEIEIPVGGIISTCVRDDALYTTNGFSYIGKVALDVGTEVMNTEGWTAISNMNAPNASFNHVSVWTGTEMIVWGGTGNAAGKYDPATDTWAAISTTNAPAGTQGSTAVWTGTEMIVWGGGNSNTGGRYNPNTDTWTSVSTTNAPQGRSNHSAVWTGTEMIIWGGGNLLNTGGRYDPATDTWTATSTTNAPGSRAYHAATWTGTEMFIYGGQTGADDGGLYNPTTDTWTATTTTNAPNTWGFGGTDAHWTGNEIILFGSIGTPGGVAVAAIYDPAADSWTSATQVDNPLTSGGFTTQWTGTDLLVYGGSSGNNIYAGVWKYNFATDTWTDYLTGAPGGRSNLTSVWTGTEFITWGGQVAFFPQNNGGRYNPGGISEVTTTADYYMYKKD